MGHPLSYVSLPHGVVHQEGHRHGANSAGDGRDVRGALGGGGVLHVPHEPVAGPEGRKSVGLNILEVYI